LKLKEKALFRYRTEYKIRRLWISDIWQVLLTKGRFYNADKEENKVYVFDTLTADRRTRSMESCKPL